MTRSHVVEDLQGLADAMEIKKYVDTINDQVKFLKTAVDHTIEWNKNKTRGNITEGKRRSSFFLIYLAISLIDSNGKYR